MNRISAQVARIADDMRKQSLFLIFGLTAEILCAASAAANDPNRNAPRNAWHLTVVAGGEPPRIPRRAPIADPNVQQASVNSETARPIDLAAGSWSLQLGMVRPPHAHQMTFGPAEGIPVAGDFNGDGFDEVGMYVDGRWFIDLNGNNRWDDGDLWMSLGSAGDQPVVGDWDRDGKADVGVVGRSNAATSFEANSDPGLVHPLNPRRALYQTAGIHDDAAEQALLRTVRSGMQDRGITHIFEFGEVGDVPVVGDWQGHGTPSIGVFRQGIWYLDIDGDGKLTEKDEVVRLGRGGDRPVVGDFNRDGVDELGIYRNGQWHIDTTGDRRLTDDDLRLTLGDDDDTPVVGDWDGDGRDQIGVVHR